jgi:excisionase family DNA binding protein
MTTTMDDLRQRATISVPEAGQVLGLERKSAYNAARRGELPTLRIGRRVLVPTAALLRMLEDASQPAGVGQ